ncbi:Na+/H+ antiporter NhaC family protein [candidate division KSB1 bacterium]|nr:Na+/H+ antiporter NhaC family protein [candidate division KSB1 bacterium]
MARTVFFFSIIALSLIPGSSWAENAASSPPDGYGFLSLLPPILAILLALLSRQVILSLFCGVWLGAWFIAHWNPIIGLMRTLDSYLIPALADRDHASIIMFSLILGGMVGIITRSGGAKGIVDRISTFAHTPRTGQLATWAMGVLIFFDDYANTLIVGNTMRPFTDRLRISREKLSYIVDSTAAPVASVALISTWIGFEMGLIRDAFVNLDIQRNIYLTFIQTIPYRFYSLLTLIFIVLLALMGRDYGPMARAERRSRKEGKVLADGAVPLSDKELTQGMPPDTVPPRARNALLPILTVILVTVLGLWWDGWRTLGSGAQGVPLYQIIGEADSFRVLMWASFSGAALAGILALSQRILTLGQTVEAFMVGVRSMIIAMIILVLAWSIGKVCADLGTANYVIGVTKGLLSPHFIPMIAFLIAAFIGFATGTSWGTMAILMPIIIPIAHRVPIDAAIDPRVGFSILMGTIAAVLAGSCFGDHCSPISDTTIMSSMASGADHIDHVRTQIPYALTTAGVGVLFGYLPAGFGISPVISLIFGILLLVVILRIFGKKV